MKKLKLALAIATLLALATIIFLYRPHRIITTPYSIALGNPDPASTTPGQVYILGIFLGSSPNFSHLRGGPPELLYEAWASAQAAPTYRYDLTHQADPDALIQLISQARIRRQLPIFNYGGTGEWIIYVYQSGNPNGVTRLMVGQRNVVAHDRTGRAPFRIIRGSVFLDALEEIMRPWW